MASPIAIRPKLSRRTVRDDLMRAFVLVTAAFIAWPSLGCMILGHEAGLFDWYAESVRTKTENKNIVVTSEPQGAKIVRTEPSGRESLIGTTPIVDVVPLEIEEHLETPKTSALWVGSALEFVGGFAMMIGGVVSAAGGGGETDLGVFFGLGMTGSLIVTSSMVDAVAALVHGGKAERVARTTAKGEYRYAARIEGLPEALTTIRLPDQATAHLVMNAPGGSSGRGPGAAWIVAVMNVEDANAQTSGGIDRSLVGNLGDQIRVFVAQRGVRTIDRGAQEDALKQQIAKVKRESYRSCYDDACQIELGKALAASHILRTRITRFGARCVLNGELIDLKAEVTVAAASSQGSCEAEGFLKMGEAVARDVIGPR